MVSVAYFGFLLLYRRWWFAWFAHLSVKLVLVLLDEYIHLAMWGFVIHHAKQNTSFLKEKCFKMKG